MTQTQDYDPTPPIASTEDYQDIYGDNKESKAKDINTCDECGNVLPSPVFETRDGGYREQVIYCSCGATYTN